MDIYSWGYNLTGIANMGTITNTSDCSHGNRSLLYDVFVVNFQDEVSNAVLKFGSMVRQKAYICFGSMVQYHAYICFVHRMYSSKYDTCICISHTHTHVYTQIERE